MKIAIISLTVASLITAMPSFAMAQETTVMHKESADGLHSKTVVNRADGSKTIVKRGVHHFKKVNISANGDKTVIKKRAD